MSDVPQAGGGEPSGQWPFGAGGFDLSQLFRMLQSEGPVNWEIAQQMAAWIAVVDEATGAPAPETPPDSATAARLDGVAAAARSAVADASGLTETLGVRFRAVDRRGWAEQTLRDLQPVLEALAGALQPPGPAPGTGPGLHPSLPDEPGRGPLGGDPFAGVLGMLGPLLLGVQSGSMIGLLAQRALGQFDLQLPLVGEPRMLLVARNADAFAEAWSLPVDELRYVLLLREAAHAAQRCVPWVQERLVRLAIDYVSAYEVRPEALEEQLGALGSMGELDPTDPGALAGMAGDPSALLGAMRGEDQAPRLRELQQFAALLEAHGDAVVRRAGEQMTPSFTRIEEALHRQRIERGQAEGFVEGLLGLVVDRELDEATESFCAGVVERAGLDGLNRLWERESMLPTPPELAAPGLWLARIELDLGEET